jgi:hypothetical protein
MRVGFLRDETRSALELNNCEPVGSKSLLTKSGVLLGQLSKGRHFVKAVYVSLKQSFNPAEFKRALLKTEDPWLSDPYPLADPHTTGQSDGHLAGRTDSYETVPHQALLTTVPTKSGVASTTGTNLASTGPNGPPAGVDEIGIYYDQEMASNTIGDR